MPVESTSSDPRSLPVLATYSSYAPMTTYQKQTLEPSVKQSITPSSSSSSSSSLFNVHPRFSSHSAVPTTLTSHLKRSRKKRSHLDEHIRGEILKLKAKKPTVFVWEIQQSLLRNGFCTSQTLPSVSPRVTFLHPRRPSLSSTFRQALFSAYSMTLTDRRA